LDSLNFDASIGKFHFDLNVLRHDVLFCLDFLVVLSLSL
jgi:hypothetical protein